MPEASALRSPSSAPRLFDQAGLEAARGLVYAAMPATPQYAWPLLAERLGCEVWVKHENHTPTGAFKVRGGLVYLDGLKRRMPDVKGVVSATRGNHGQSIAFAGRRHRLPVVIVVPHGNSVEKNAAMRAFGAEVVIDGDDFDASRIVAARIAEERGLHMVPSFHADLVRGVATYAHELFTHAPPLDAVYVPIGLGSGICGLIHARDLLGLSTRIVGVVSNAADAYALSLEAGHVVTTATAQTGIADGMSCRIPDPLAFEIIRHGVDHVVRVDEAQIAAAIRALHEDTHNTAEGAGAAPLAALLQEREAMQGKRVAVILCGANIDRPVLTRVLAG